jgi:hypothetical protein
MLESYQTRRQVLGVPHRTNARLGGYSERRVCSVVSMPAGGAGWREASFDGGDAATAVLKEGHLGNGVPFFILPALGGAHMAAT